MTLRYLETAIERGTEVEVQASLSEMGGVATATVGGSCDCDGTSQSAQLVLALETGASYCCDDGAE